MEIRLRIASDTKTRLFTCVSQVKSQNHFMTSERRSGCPIALALELVGDRWSLLVIRDLAFRGLRRFSEFRDSGEGIATNILSDRLRRLTDCGVVSSHPDPEDGRRVRYFLTDAGLDLLPALVELARWSIKHDERAALPARLQKIFKEGSRRAIARIRRDHQRERGA